MLVYITNRNYKGIPATGITEVQYPNIRNHIGDVLSKKTTQERVLIGVSYDHKTLSFYSNEEQGKVFEEINNRKDEDWVVHIHGYHQDPDENLIKMTHLRSHHRVNVIIFSWPSHPIQLEPDTKDIWKEVLLSYGDIKSGLIKGVLAYVKHSFKDFISSYKPARNNAIASIDDVDGIFSSLNDKVFKNFTKSPVLVVHSMGNYLLQKYIESKNKLPISFSNILLHEADVAEKSHNLWVNKLKDNASGKIYITQYYKDHVLIASNALHKYFGTQEGNRLGVIEREYIVDNKIIYLNFDEAIGVTYEHEFFLRGAGKTNKYIHALLGRISRNDVKGDLLPENIGQSRSGFSKMPTDINLYKMQYLEPWFYDEDDDLYLDVDPEDNSDRESLSEFKDPLNQAEFDPLDNEDGD